ncbi:MAG: hypothetical protein OJF49_001882 [Ktedonobacterales bacterium]|nr:MAG: hypothetical protein OJF49_001882 [Ktedonobacterales bacterium]
MRLPVVSSFSAYHSVVQRIPGAFVRHNGGPRGGETASEVISSATASGT